MIGPVFVQHSTKFSTIVFLKVDVDEVPVRASTFLPLRKMGPALHKCNTGPLTKFSSVVFLKVDVDEVPV